MKCSHPKKIVVRFNGTFYTLYVPCGRCYACQCASRAEWALRCRYELQETSRIGGNCVFLTLHYDNNHLPHTCNHNTFVHNVNLEMLKRYQDRRWDFARLDETHMSKFCAQMNYHFKRLTHKNVRFRWFASAEYGDRTHRPHIHILLFSPLPLTKFDYQKIVSLCWRYGDFDVQFPRNPYAVINYVAKHQVKSCSGSYEQNKEAPIFKRSSRYCGGIGYSIRKDIDLKERFFNDDKEKFIVVQSGTVQYKVPYPRYLRRYYRDNLLTEEQLSQLSNESYKTYRKMIIETLIQHLQLGNSDNVELSVINFLRKEDEERRKSYEHKRLLKKSCRFIKSPYKNYNNNLTY